MSDTSKWPQWLKDARTENAQVEICAGRVIWRGGEWHGGVWHGGENRLLMHAAMIGIVFDSQGNATAYRSTRSDNSGRYNRDFIQKSGPFVVDDARPPGTGMCCAGIHVTTAAMAWTYFGVDKTAKLWRVTFRREDLLDCDGEKARIRAGVAEEVPWPF